MTEPKSLEALAAEMADAGPHTGAAWAELASGWAKQLRAYLAARPASDLEKRLRERAAARLVYDTTSWGDAKAFSEAADALAAADALVEATYINTAARITQLERELAHTKTMLESTRNNRNTILQTLEAERTRRADLERELAGANRHTISLETRLRAAEARLAAALESLAARPASDLEQRLRGEADRIGCRNGVVSDKHTAVLILEAADANLSLTLHLERMQMYQREAEDRIAQLERELKVANMHLEEAGRVRAERSCATPSPSWSASWRRDGD